MVVEYYNKQGVCYEGVRQSQKIFLIYTYKCNAACEHCLTESNPGRAEKLTVPMVKGLLKVGRSFDKRWLMISGGEPLLYFREIEEICNYAAGLGYYCCIGTNGFWAKSRATTLDRLTRLKEAGVQAVFPSATTYHSKYVPTERVALIAAVTAELGLVCEINFYPSSKPTADQRISKQLKLETQGWYTDGLILTGNNVDHLKPYFRANSPGELDDCGSVHLSISAHGDAICNCNVTYRCDEFRASPFYLGNIYADEATEIFERERSNNILQFMMSDNKNLIHDVLMTDPEVVDGYQQNEACKRYYSATEYYLDVFAKPIYVAAIERAARRHSTIRDISAVAETAAGA
jgi:MoaA/NifB/PqqE/SkfB family radical SAM enzyme